MTAIKFNLSTVKKLSSPNLITFTDDRIADMKECTDFLPSPTPTVAVMTELRETYQAAESNFKTNRSELNKQARDAAYDALIKGHVNWVAYGEPIIGDDEKLAARFGYPPYAVRTNSVVPEGVPPKPVMELTPNPGEVILRAVPYKQERKAVFYNWQISEDGGETYSYLPAKGNSHRRRTKLALGKSYMVRVAYATTAGEGPFSDWLEISLTKDTVMKMKMAA